MHLGLLGSHQLDAWSGHACWNNLHCVATSKHLICGTHMAGLCSACLPIEVVTVFMKVLVQQVHFAWEYNNGVTSWKQSPVKSKIAQALQYYMVAGHLMSFDSIQCSMHCSSSYLFFKCSHRINTQALKWWQALCFLCGLTLTTCLLIVVVALLFKLEVARSF